MDRDLVIRAQGGDHDAFAVLVTNGLARLHTIAWLILHDEGRAEDAVQEAYAAAWRDLRGLRDPDRFTPWIQRLLVRACHRLARGEWRRVVREVPLLPTDGPVQPDAQSAFALRDQFERALADLQPDQRAVLVLTFHLDLPLAEAAQVLGIPVGTMKSRLHRATQALRARIEADERRIGVGEGRLA